MPYITRVLAERCRNVTHLDIDLTPPQGEPQSFLHLILTGPNGSGKSGILDAIHKELTAGLFEAEDPREALPKQIAGLQASNVKKPEKNLESAINSFTQRLVSLERISKR